MLTDRTAPRGPSRRRLATLCALSLVTGLALIVAPADAQRRDAGGQGPNDAFFVSARVSTLGLGADLSRSLARRRLALRFGYSGFSTDFNGTESDIDYAIDLSLSSLAVNADWHPWGNGLFLTGGALVNNNEITAVGEPDGQTVEIGDETFLIEDVGTLTGAVDFEDLAPMIGLGWNGAFGRSRFGFGFSAGVVFQGEPRVTLVADGPIADDPTFQEELDRELAELQDEVDGFTLYPVVNLGLNYRF